MKKIFFFDIDNTLLDHTTNQIPASALHAIEDLKKAGHVVAIATGRGYGHAAEFIDLVQPEYTITQNGAQITRGEEVIEKNPLNHSELMRLFELMIDKNISYGISDGLGGHVSSAAEEVMKPMESVEISFQQDLAFYQTQDVFQAWMFFHESFDDVLIPELLANFPHFDYVRWHETAMDVLPKGINKLTGCQTVLRAAGMSAQQAYAFGDGLNDLEMLQGMGTGIAVGNAHPRLKAVADRHAESISEGGIAKMVYQLLAEFEQSAEHVVFTP